MIKRRNPTPVNHNNPALIDSNKDDGTEKRIVLLDKLFRSHDEPIFRYVSSLCPRHCLITQTNGGNRNTASRNKKN